MIPIITTPEQLKFLLSRDLIRAQAIKPSVRLRMLRVGDGELNEDHLPYITPTEFWSPSGRRIVNCWFDQQLQVISLGETVEDEGIGEDAQVIVPAGETWEIFGIEGQAQMDANVANRQLQIQVTGTVIGGIAAPWLWVDTTGLLMTLGQGGGSMLTAGFAPNLLTNLIGVIAIVANENPLPFYLEEGGIIAHANDNVQVGDIQAVRVFYKRWS